MAPALVFFLLALGQVFFALLSPSLSSPMSIPPSEFKVDLITPSAISLAFAPGTVETTTSTPASLPSSLSGIHLTPGAKFGLFVACAFVFFLIGWLLFRIYPTFKQSILQQAPQPTPQELAARNCLIRERHRAREVPHVWGNTEPATTSGSDEPEEIELECLRGVTLTAEATERLMVTSQVAGDCQQLQEHDEGKAEDEEQRTKATTEGEQASIVLADPGTHRGMPTDPSRSSVIVPAQDSSIVEADGSSLQPLSSDEVLRSVHALGYEPVNEAQRDKDRKEALNKLEGH